MFIRYNDCTRNVREKITQARSDLPFTSISMRSMPCMLIGVRKREYAKLKGTSRIWSRYD
jgi:hypothetical protein